MHVVQVSVLVRDDKGAFVKGLEARDFRLREDDVPQRLAHVANQDTPLEVVMALDISASMADAIGDVRSSARTFISALRERDALTILGFNDNIFTVARREDACRDAVARSIAWRRGARRRSTTSSAVASRCCASRPAARAWSCSATARTSRAGSAFDVVERGAAVERRGHVRRGSRPRRPMAEP